MLNFSASSVADVTMSLRSLRLAHAFFMRPNSTSVWMVRSWASSSMITEYLDMSGSC